MPRIKIPAAALRKLERQANEARAVPAGSIPPQTFTVPYPPGDNRRAVPVIVRRGGKVTPSVVLTKEVREYVAAAQSAIRYAGVRMVSGPLSVTAVVYRPSRRPDLTGSIKVMFDAMTGAAWVDDGQVDELRIVKRHDPKRPRVEVTVQAAEL